MNKADWVVIGSVVLTLIPLMRAVIAKVWDHSTIYGKAEIGIWIVMIVAAFAVNDKNLVYAVIFGLIAGTLMQPKLADPYLTEKALVYGDKKHLFVKTPLWVASLWGIALAQLYYLWTRMDALTDYLGFATEPFSQYLLFVAIGFLYFYVFELIVNNFTSWWWRKNCRQPLGVAIYASLAELFTIVLIIFLAKLTTLPLTNEILSFLVLIDISLIGGILIALIFCRLCGIFTYPSCQNKPADD